jgi:hypothetical protein
MDFISRLDRDRASSIIGIAAAAALVYSTLSFFSEKNKSPKGYREIPTPGSSYPYIGNTFKNNLLLSNNHSQIYKKF